MEMKKILLAMAATTLVACGGDDKDSDPTPPVVSDFQACQDAGNNICLNPTAAVGSACGTVGTTSGSFIRSESGSYTEICDLQGKITEDATLTADFVYRLNGYVNVGEGFGESGAVNAAALDEEGTDEEIVAYMKGDGSATLTIEAGVQFRSDGRGSLIISRGSKIMANGTADAPIVMSSIDAGFEGQGEWGGLVLQGFAKNNKCGEGSTDLICDTADEAGTGFHGGNDDADSSGSIEFLIVAEGGYEIAPDSEVNGITLHSVGFGTKLENIMVYNNADDGIEWFGGAANVKNLILVDNGDESLDWDDGFRGNVQFVLVRQGVSNKGDHGIEADTLGASHANPESDPVVANVTFQTVNNNFGDNSDEAGSDDLFRFKKETNGTLINVAAVGYAECVKAEGANVDVEFVNVVASCTAYEGGSYETGDAADGSIVYSDQNVDATNFGNNTVELGSLFEVTSNNGTLGTAPAFPSANASTDFFSATTYVGAVDPSATEAWYAWAEAVIPAAFAQ